MYILTGRFNNATLEKNHTYRYLNKYGCIYCCPLMISSKVPIGDPIFVIEMNNETNQIVGVGLIKNKIVTDKIMRVHDDYGTNRFIYLGDHFVNRNEMISVLSEDVVSYVDDVLFYGRTHSKRGCGLTLFPKKMLELLKSIDIDLEKLLKYIFIVKYKLETVTIQNEYKC